MGFTLKIMLYVSFVSMVAGCGETSFTSGGAAKSAPKSVDPSSGDAEGKNDTDGKVDVLGEDSGPVDSLGGEILSETFLAKGESASGKADILFLIDTSGSMRGEQEHVAKNLSDFISSLNSQADTKVGVIYSDNLFNFNEKLSAEVMSQITFFDEKVSSSNSFNIFLKVLGPGQGKAFFRSEADPFIVVVTDDNARMNFSEFSTEITPWFSGSKPKIFSFAGLENSQTEASEGCKIAEVGTEYIKAASETGAKVFDICLSDWKSNFSELSSTIIAQVSSDFELSSEIKEVAEVLLDGEKVASEKYSFAGKKLKFSNDVGLKVGSKVEVKYTAR